MNPVKDRFYYVYILQSFKNNKWYTGFTNDLRKRLHSITTMNQHILKEGDHSN